MALTLALVSFSCTGPILGSLLAGALSADGGAMQLTAGMGGFGLALALPFGLFAAFPSWLNTLPKSGGWMTTLKVVLGFLELALALKFLSNADLVKHWGILKIEPFLALWILIFLAMGFYLLGKIRFPHDSPIKKLSTGRLISALASFGIAVYLATGFIYDKDTGSLRSLKLLSGLAPPSGYSWFYPKECPQNLNCFKDFEKGLAYAKEVNKPIMLDFTGHACVNCRKMEEHVWPVKQVYNLLKNEYVLISLYVDEKIELPVEEQIIVPMKTGGTRKLRTTGHKWQYFQTENFDNNSQPFYVLLSHDGTLLTEPVGYMPEAPKYAAFLQCGLNHFRSLEAAK
jgi:thiol:disulfide interchange protein DsbD